jgi:hypothetical protein
MKQFLAALFGTLIASCAVLVGAWSGDRSSPTESISSRIEPDIIPAGRAGEVQYRFQRFRACDRRVMASIIDSSGKTFEFVPTVSPPAAGRIPGQMNSYAKPFRVPRSASPGPVIYHVDIADACNPLHTIWPIRRTIEVPFEIAPMESEIGPMGYRSGEGLAQCLMRRFAAAGR